MIKYNPFIPLINCFMINCILFCEHMCVYVIYISDYDKFIIEYRMYRLLIYNDNYLFANVPFSSP